MKTQDAMDSANSPVPSATSWYRAFGLRFASAMALPALSSDAAGDPDITITLRPWPAMRSAGEPGFDDEAGRMIMAWDDVGSFSVTASQIEVCPDKHANPALLPLPVIGPAFGTLLHLRGILVLHGSAVMVAGRPVIFVGDKGAGKSTTAAAFCAAGHALLADDLAAISLEAGTPLLWPGYSQLKLEPRTASQVFGTASSPLPSPDPRFPKELHAVRGAGASPVPLPLVMVLERGTGTRAERLSAGDAFLALVRYSYAPRISAGLMRGERGALHATLCASLSRAGAVHRLAVPDDVSRLQEVIGVAADLAGSVAGRT